jgi:hypothetical protein
MSEYAKGLEKLALRYQLGIVDRQLNRTIKSSIFWSCDRSFFDPVIFS